METEPQIKELFERAIMEKDDRKLFENVELLIFLIKIKNNLEIPFTNEGNGNLKLAYEYYLKGKYRECITELRKVKRTLIRNIRKG
ncbi:MAG: hypothetical protein ACP5LX_02105 [Nitrososphaeria archaeon]|jgi:hypothetical protein